MILEQRTFEKFGYKFADVLPKSRKNIVVECDYCEEEFLLERWIITRGFKYTEKYYCPKQECKKQKRLEDHKCRFTSSYLKIGEKFNFLTVVSEPFIKEYENSKSNRAYALFRCDCGNEIKCSISNIKNGNPKSCGCKRKNLINDVVYHGDCNFKLYHIWGGMRDRCFNKKSESFYLYGDKGITVCCDWLFYLKFKEWSMNNGYKEGLSLDRINPHGNYCPENCQWVTKSENSKRVTSARDEIIERQKTEINQLKNEILELKNEINHNNLACF